MFGLNRSRAAEETDPITDQASWQIAHGTDHHDRTPDQDRRARELAVLLNNGIDVEHASFYRWLHDTEWRARGGTDDT